MADKVPIRTGIDGSSVTGLAVFCSGETVGIAHGGTGLATIGSNELVTGNGTSAMTSESNLTFDGTTLATTAFTATGNVSLNGGSFVFNEAGADKDFRIEGDTDANLFFADASTDRIGIGTATPSHLLDVEGVANIATCLVTPKLCIYPGGFSSGYVLPAADGSAGQLMCTDGSGALAFATAASSGISWDGSTANGVATYKDADEATVEANLTFDGTTLIVTHASTPAIEVTDTTNTVTGKWFSDNDTTYFGTTTNHDLTLKTNNVNRLHIDNSGNVGIGTVDPNGPLDVNVSPGNYMRLSDPSASTTASETVLGFYGSTNAGTRLGYMGFGSTTHSGMSIFNDQADFMSFGTSATERMRINAVGAVGIGTATNCGCCGALNLYKDSTNFTRFWDNAVATQYMQSSGANSPSLVMKNSAGHELVINVFQAVNFGGALYGHNRCCLAIVSWNSAGPFIVGNYAAHPLIFGTSNSERVCIAAGGAMHVHGAFSKGSGSFNIAHPLESKKDTHRLIHSFIEGPQADLIYRGVAQLVDGRAEINVDTEAGMTEGTFVVLNRCVQVFTTNETNWDLIKGSVTGNILTIESKTKTSKACISWMVVGERQDEHMKHTETEWTDDDGRPIIEPLTPIKEE